MVDRCKLGLRDAGFRFSKRQERTWEVAHCGGRRGVGGRCVSRLWLAGER